MAKIHTRIHMRKCSQTEGRCSLGFENGSVREVRRKRGRISLARTKRQESSSLSLSLSLSLCIVLSTCAAPGPRSRSRSTLARHVTNANAIMPYVFCLGDRQPTLTPPSSLTFTSLSFTVSRESFFPYFDHRTTTLYATPPSLRVSNLKKKKNCNV